jgi:hypothetical protein
VSDATPDHAAGKTGSKVDKRFLIIGNGRSGSTWLLTSLDLLPDVSARQELKWRRDEGGFVPDAHRFIDRSSTISDVIDGLSGGAKASENARGSKLIFDPYYFYNANAFANLRGTLGVSVSPILLRRNYLELWLSWKARGVYHELNEENAKDGQQDPMLKAIRRLSKPADCHLVLHHQGAPLAAFDAPAIAYPLTDAIDDLLQFYSNDIQTLNLVKSQGGLVLDYADVARRLLEVATFVGSSVDAKQIERVVQAPVTRKLSSLDHCLHPAEPLRDIAQALDNSFWDEAKSNRDPANGWEWIAPDSASIRNAGVAATLARYGFLSERGTLQWQVRKPVISA